jgi:hypothetical protein
MKSAGALAAAGKAAIRGDLWRSVANCGDLWRSVAIPNGMKADLNGLSSAFKTTTWLGGSSLTLCTLRRIDLRLASNWGVK